MQIFYQIIYQSTINRVIRTLLKMIPGLLQLIQKEIISLGYQAFRSVGMYLHEERLDASSKVAQIENYFFVPKEKIDLVKEFVR